MLAPTMAKKRQRGRPPKEPRAALNIKILQSIREELDDYILGSEPQPGLTSTVETALRRFLAAERARREKGDREL